MKIFLSVAASILTAGIASAGSMDSLEGNWIGILKLGERPSRIELRIAEMGQTITMPLDGVIRQPLRSFEFKKAVGESSVDFEFQHQKNSFQFNGRAKMDSIKGKVSSSGRQGTFELVRNTSVEVSKYFGTYQFPNGSFLYLRTWDELGDGQLTYFDDSGHAGPLFAKSQKHFFSGPSLWIPLPLMKTIVFHFDQSGNVEALTWTENGKAPMEAKKVLVSREEAVVFENGDVRLAGSLTIPAGEGKFPAVVLIHGSGPVTRDFFGPIAYQFARHKIAALSYDKRGIGKSGGHWMDAGFEDYASDALAGLRYLCTRKEIDCDDVGLFGISQGGWVAPLAASKDSKVAFVVILSAPAVTPAEQEMQRTAEEMKVQGIAEDQIHAAIKGYQEQIQGLRTEAAKVEFENHVEKFRSEGKVDALNERSLENPRYLLFYRRILDYDPLPALRNLKSPVLALYGELDRTVPVAANKEILEKTLLQSGHKNYQIRVLPKGDHALMLSETGSSSEFPYENQFVPGFFEMIVNWIHSLAD